MNGPAPSRVIGKPAIPLAAKMPAAIRFLALALALPAPVDAAPPAYRKSATAKPGTSIRRPAPAGPVRAGNEIIRNQRSSRGQSSTSVSSGPGGQRPSAAAPGVDTWTAPARPVRAQNQQTAPVESVPVKLPNASSGELKLSRQATHAPQPPGPGRVVETVEFTPDQRAASTHLGYRALLQHRAERLLKDFGGRADRNALLAQIRATGGRSATRLMKASGQGGTDSPGSWNQSPPRMSRQLQNEIAQGLPLKPVPVRLPNAVPGELKLSRHLRQTPRGQERYDRVQSNQ